MAKLDYSIKTIVNGASFDKELKEIKIEELQPSEQNFYEVSELDELALNISVNGLLENFLVMEAPQGSDKPYIILGGHRRYRAILLGEENGLTMPQTVMCRVKPYTEDEEQIKYWLISNNRYRQKTEANLIAEYNFLRDYYKKKRKDGSIKIEGRLREFLAKELGVSTGTLGTIEYVEKHADDETKEKVHSGEMSANAAANAIRAEQEKEREDKPTENKAPTDSETEDTTSSIDEPTAEPTAETQLVESERDYLTNDEFMRAVEYCFESCIAINADLALALEGVKVKLQVLLKKNISDILQIVEE